LRKILIGVLLAAAMAVAAFGIAVVDPVGAVSAAVTGTPTSHPGPLEQTLSDLVGKGTINQSQADAITSELQAKRRADWATRPVLGKMLLTPVAQQLNMDPKDLMTELRSGKSIAQVAQEKGVDPQAVIDHLVSTLDARIDAQVASKKLAQDKADVMKQNLPPRVADFVNKVRGHTGAQPKAAAPSTTDTTAPESTTTAATPQGTGN